ncbi:ThuA domain-containing protein [Chitinophaga sp. MM2321]|uniref:ThuA domain-containing protein n=1 Tax=Chitinophaga sp. MM2321 TaxID=3137178 RepID=UPI0032D5731E
MKDLIQTMMATNKADNHCIGQIPYRCVISMLLLIVCSSIHPVSAQTTKVIYFMAGKKDHAWPSRHETEKDLLVLQRCLDSVTNIKGVKIVTRFIYNRTALDINDMKDAAAIVIESSAEYSSADRTHPLFPPSAGNTKTYEKEVVNYLDQVDSLHKAGMGIIVLHWAVAAENQKAANLYWNWFGGGYIPGYSQNPLGMWTVTPIKQAQKHPVMRGVGAWTYKDEIFSRFMVIPQDQRRTDLLMGEAPKTNMGPVASRCITWAFEDGLSRALIYGGMDYHAALLQDNYRRFLLNAIVWAAGIEVPADGVKSSAKGLQLVASRPDQFDNMK